MARLQSDIKLGFYPTDKNSVNKFIDRIGDQGGFAVCDPCCGEGEALSLFKRFEGVKTYGVELDEERAKKAATIIDELINDDALRVTKTQKAFGLLFLNPPYGEVRNLQDKVERLEINFVKRWSGSVADGGYMLLIINSSSATIEMAKALSNSCFHAEAVFFDKNKEYEAYGQYFILLKRDCKGVPQKAEELLEAIQMDKAIDLDSIESFDIKLPKGASKITFRAPFGLQEWQMIELINQRATKSLAFREKLLSFGGEGASSIQAPNDGQAALLLGAGLCQEAINGFLIKGSVTKVEVVGDGSVTKDSKGRTKTRVQEQFASEVYAFDTTSAKYFKLI